MEIAKIGVLMRIHVRLVIWVCLSYAYEGLEAQPGTSTAFPRHTHMLAKSSARGPGNRGSFYAGIVCADTCM